MAQEWYGVHNDQRRKKRLGFLLVLLFGIGMLVPAVHDFAFLPNELRMFSGHLASLPFHLPVSSTVHVTHPDVISVKQKSQRAWMIASKKEGHAQLTFQVFGKIPLKTVKIQVLPEKKLIPGGQSIGVKLKSDGMLVVGYHAHESPSPAERAGIQIGDYLTKVNGVPLKEVRQLSKAIEQAGKKREPLVFTVWHEGKEKTVKLTPYYDQKERQYRLGVYIRNMAAGVGTLTFYDPENKTYGALGHLVTDAHTQQPIRVGEGKIIRSHVTSVQKGESGEPGEKRAIFFQEHDVLGNIKRNTIFGIFGQMRKFPEKKLWNHPLPVALPEQVQEGPAQILTVVRGNHVEAFNIEIVHAFKQKYPAPKGLVVRVTDARLLQQTGGIVQGMSGSPIIQNGILVGAVTHVFVNDPTMGYGTHIEWMLKEAEKANTTYGVRSFFV